MTYISSKKLPPYQMGGHILKIRKEYLDLKTWFDYANDDQQKLFAKYCKNFISCGRSQKRKMIDCAEEIKVLTGSSSNVITKYATKYSSREFLGIRSVAMLSFIRVFYESKYSDSWFSLSKYSLKKEWWLGISINIDNLLLWSSIAQKRVFELRGSKDKEIKDAIKYFEYNLANAVKRRYLVTQAHRSELLYLETIAPVLGDNIPILFDYFGNNPGYGRLHVINPEMTGQFNLTWLTKFCLYPLIFILNGEKPLDIDGHHIRAKFFGGSN